MIDKGAVYVKIKCHFRSWKIKKVLIHRPGLELEHLTPKWLNQLLFDDIPWPDKAKRNTMNLEISSFQMGLRLFILKL